MPIEIRELVIKTMVQDEHPSQQQASEPSSVTKDAIIAECVDKIMEILKDKQER